MTSLHKATNSICWNNSKYANIYGLARPTVNTANPVTLNANTGHTLTYDALVKFYLQAPVGTYTKVILNNIELIYIKQTAGAGSFIMMQSFYLKKGDTFTIWVEGSGGAGSATVYALQ